MIGRVSDFRRFVAANAVTQLGTQVTLVALPLAAVLTLHASAFELGLLSASQMIAFLVLGLPAGAWVDRMRRRPILITADLVRGVALATIPAATWLGGLTMPHLFVVAVIMGVGAVFFDVAHMSFLPAIVSKEGLERGNGLLEASRNVSLLAGPGLGGWLVAALSAPIALVADAASYLVSGLLLSRVRATETPGGGERRIREGLAFVARDPVLRRVAAGGALIMAANAICVVGQPLYLVRQLGLSPGGYGLMLSASAVGALVGSALVARLTARFGTGRVLYGSALAAVFLYLPALWTGPGWRLAFFPVAAALIGVAGTVFGVTQLSYRQRVTPEHLLGRVNASMRFLMWGAYPLGGLVGGAVGEWLGGYAVFALGVALTGLSHLAVVTSPRILATAT